jgi:hypothetical protein
MGTFPRNVPIKHCKGGFLILSSKIFKKNYKLFKKGKYSVVCGTPDVAREPRRSDAREPASAFTGQMRHGAPPNSCNTGKKTTGG